jgi:hypothetical protein
LDGGELRRLNKTLLLMITVNGEPAFDLNEQMARHTEADQDWCFLNQRSVGSPDLEWLRNLTDVLDWKVHSREQSTLSSIL